MSVIPTVRRWTALSLDALSGRSCDMPLAHETLLEVKGGEKALEAWSPAMSRPILHHGQSYVWQAADVELPSFTDRVYTGGKEAWKPENPCFELRVMPRASKHIMQRGCSGHGQRKRCQGRPAAPKKIRAQLYERGGCNYCPARWCCGCLRAMLVRSAGADSNSCEAKAMYAVCNEG